MPFAQSSSIPLQISLAPGLTAAIKSSQSPATIEEPAIGLQEETPAPAPNPSASTST